MRPAQKAPHAVKAAVAGALIPIMALLSVLSSERRANGPGARTVV